MEHGGGSVSPTCKGGVLVNEEEFAIRKLHLGLIVNRDRST
jgi:hypothetical protein